MYKPSKSWLKKGKIIERGEYFNEKAYEYTLRMPQSDFGLKKFDAQLNDLAAEHKGILGQLRHGFSDSGALILIAYTWRVEILLDGGENGCFRYVFCNSNWQSRYNRLSNGDELNIIQTAFEACLCEIDPHTWLREMPVAPHITNKPLSVPEIWETTKFISTLTREAAAEKGLYEGYLADRLRQLGLSVRGGSEIPEAQPNPLIEACAQQNIERAAKMAEEAKREPTPEEIAAAKKAEEEKRKYPNIPDYHFLYLTTVGDEAHPYLFAGITENKELLPEPEDGEIRCYRMTGLRIQSKQKGMDSYKMELNDIACRDYRLYVTDSRIAVINPKYNKDRSVGWIGLGGPDAALIAEGITLVERAVRAGLRTGKAICGHLRYEWLAQIIYSPKRKMLDDELLRLCYVDISRTTWLIDICLNTHDASAEILANDILHKFAVVRKQMTDKKTEELSQFVDGVLSGKIGIQKSNDPSRASSIVFPYYMYATKGANYRHMKYLGEEKPPIPVEVQNEAPQPTVPSETKVEKRFCVYCGKEIRSTDAFCPWCGKKQA